MSKYIVILGGSYSACGKGTSAASLGLILKMRGFKINLIKCDPYLNVNCGTMNPAQHGEVHICDDGTEADLDLGHYERIANVIISKDNILTSGMLYKELLQNDINGKYLGQTIQIVPHFTNLIQEKFIESSKGYDITIVEIGGTVGDFESAGMYEAIAQFKYQNPDDVMIAMVAPIIWNATVKEPKTKPLQNAVRNLRSAGLQCDMLLCRVPHEFDDKLLKKVADLTYVQRESVFYAPDVDNIYKIPIEFYNRNIDDLVVSKLGLKRSMCRIHKYRELIEKHDQCTEEVTIGVVCKYSNTEEAYLSLREALFHASLINNVNVKIKWINAEDLEQSKSVDKFFEDVNGCIVPGGFDSRGVEGKIKAIKYVRDHKIPFLGICLGLQCAVIEFSRNVCGLQNANSTEFDKNTVHPVIHFVKGQETLIKKSGTMRLGAYDCELNKNSLAYELYGEKLISERHRHRYEVNNEFVNKLEDKGFKVSGRNPESGLVEVMELDENIHPYFLATQAHPEFKSTLEVPAPLFKGLVAAAINVGVFRRKG